MDNFARILDAVTVLRNEYSSSYLNTEATYCLGRVLYLSWMGGRETGWKEGGERSPVTGGRLVIPLIVDIPAIRIYQ